MNPVLPDTQMSVSEDAIIAVAASIRERGNVFIAAALERRGVRDLLPAHGAVLHALFEESPLRMQELARRIGRRKNTLTGLIDTLEARGYCRRERDASDGRGQRVALTEKGESMRQIQVDISKDLLRIAWNGIDEPERRRCMETLRKVLLNLSDDDPCEQNGTAPCS